jgi:hypothetical protein
MPFVGRAAQRALTGHCIHVRGRATSRAEAAAQERPIGSFMPDTTHYPPGRVVLGPDPNMWAHLTRPKITRLGMTSQLLDSLVRNF